MTWRLPLASVPIAALSLILGLAWIGCDYSAEENLGAPPARSQDRVALPSAVAPKVSTAAVGRPVALSADEKEKRDAILQNVVQLIQSAATTPGSDHIVIATENLNQYFAEDVGPADFAMSPLARAFLLGEMPEAVIRSLELPTFTNRDARHLEDSMLYHGIATRVAGDGDDLARVRRVFDWVVRQVQLVPPNSLGGNGPQVAARPFDVIVRGLGTEQDGRWSERGWLFMSLCRQLGIDVGIVTYTPAGGRELSAWICAAVVDGKAYLFDPRLGMPVPGPGGLGVATVEQAAVDPIILESLNLPGRPYGVRRVDLISSPTKIGIMIDSSPGLLSPRMRLLQRRLAGKNRTILYRDPAEQAEQFAKALGDRSGGAKLWPLPITVLSNLFTNAEFVEATGRTLRAFDPKLPLLYARMAQLRGDLADAKVKYINLRFAENPTLVDKKTPIDAATQRVMDTYATYFLSLCHLDLGNDGEAERELGETLKMLPEPARNQTYLNMFRWGAQANMARVLEAKGEPNRAAAYYALADPTRQGHGNLLRARDLIWLDPTAPVPDPIPPPPPPTSMSESGPSTAGPPG